MKAYIRIWFQSEYKELPGPEAIYVQCNCNAAAFNVMVDLCSASSE